MTKFKEHFKINGGTFKTHEDEIEAYVKKMIKDFIIFELYSNLRMSFTEEQKEFLAEEAYKEYKKELYV